MMTSAKPYLTSLTPLRGIAALLVVIFHSSLPFPFVPPGYTQLISNGWLWVDFFFILSGFVMAYVYGAQFTEKLSKKVYWQYLGARFARVYPLHLVTLAWALVVALIIRGYASGLDPFFAAIWNPWAAPACLLLVQSLNLYITAPLNTPSWSLSTEWWVYMVFPLLVPFFHRLRLRGQLLTLLGIAAFYVFIKFVLGPLERFDHQPTLDLITKFAIFRCLAGFLLGMLLCELYRRRTGYDLLQQSWCFVAVSLGTLLAMHLGADELLIVALFPLVLLTAAYNTTGVKRFLDTRPLQRLGDWSFSIYMVHMPISFTLMIWDIKANPAMFADFMALISRQPDYQLGVWKCLQLVALTMLVAPLTYRYLEVPARNYLNRRFRARKPVTA